MSRKNLGTREKYDRLARGYDLMELFPERLAFARFRQRLLAQIRGQTLLEVGVGTGKNIPYYPRGMAVTAVDFSPQMLQRARTRAKRLHAAVQLQLMDIESLTFVDDSFDGALATFVFCSVPDPLSGLAEVRRVLKPGGRFYALEHVRPKGKVLGGLFDRLAPAIVERTGVHINRDTVDNIRTAGFAIEAEQNLILDIFKLIVARPIK